MSRWLALAFGLAAAGLAPAGARAAPASEAASFDCARAASPLEREICRTPDARKADRELAAAYAAALAAIPEGTRPALRDSQRTFLAFVEPACRVAGHPVGSFAPGCVAVQFRERVIQINPAATLDRRSGLTFLTLADLRALPAGTKAQVGDLPEADTLKVYRVQIVSPSSPAEQRWNAMISERLDRYRREPFNRFGPGMGEMSFEIDLEGVAPGLIDSSIAVAFTPQQGRRVGSHWSLTLGRELVASDLFANPAATFDLIAGFGLDEMLRSDAGDGKPPSRTRMRKEIRVAAAQPVNWAINPDGFTVCLDNFGAHGERFTVPWSKLRPFLKPDLPFDPAKVQ